MRRARDDARQRMARPEPTAAELLERDRARARSRRQERERRDVVKALERELRDYRRRLAFLDRLDEAPDPKLAKVRRRRGQGKRLPAATYVMLASDWHLEERVRPETVGHRNEYDPDIARERAAQFWVSNLTMLKAARSAWDVRDAVLWLGGDLITGYIHEEYEEENFLSPPEASLLAHEVLEAGILHLLAESDLDRIIVPTSHGNHGRTTKKMRYSTAAKNSYEWLLYRFLEARFADEARVKFQVANGYHNHVDLYGFRIRFHHGDAVRYQGGVGGITVPLYRRLGRQAEGGDHVDLDAFGHHHVLGAPRRAVHNGSLIGWNAYAEAKGLGYEPPMQASFVVDERHKVVSNFNPILVDRSRRKSR